LPKDIKLSFSTKKSKYICLHTPMENFAEGEILLIDKPLDWTSFDVVNKIKYQLKRKFGAIKIGHAGTLDPRATGLLIVCTGKKTKIIESIQQQKKVYSGTIFLGAETESYDTEKPAINHQDIKHITEQYILDCAATFLGEQLQFPPIHSAVKVNGKRAYKLARAGQEVEVKPKLVHIYQFKIKKIELPYIHFYIECSKGTYIRSIAHDFGKKLQNAAYLLSLRREKIGEYDVEHAQTVENLCTTINNHAVTII
jgi:tRNA pseudouridine55 synthase